MIILTWRPGGSKTKTQSKKNVPAITDFSPVAMQKAIFTETIQHPTTIYPAGIFLVSLLYTTLISLNPTSFAICFGSGLFSLGSWVFNFFIRGKDFEMEYIRNLRKTLDEHTQRALKDLKKELLENACPEGAQQIDKFKEKFESLDELLREKLDEGELTFSRYLGMSKQVYFSGIDNLQDIAAALKSISAIDPDHIKSKLVRLKRIKEPDESVLQEIKNLEIRQRLREDQLNKVKRLLCQNEMAMTQLDKTTVAVAEMDTIKGQAEVDMETAMTELANITKRAKEYSI